jgi:hypothetical protein
MLPVTAPLLHAFGLVLTALGLAIAAYLIAPIGPEVLSAAELTELRRALACYAAVAALFALTCALYPARRALALARHRRRPHLLGRLIGDMSSSSRRARQRALQLLADYAGHPFGAVACWPYQWHTAEQFESLVALYREWWQHHQARAPKETLSKFILARSRAIALAGHNATLREGSDIREAKLGRELPPLAEELFVESMRGRVEQALRHVAQTINHARDGALVAAGEEAVRSVFVELLWDALEQGLRMRLAADAELPPPSPPAATPHEAHPSLRSRARLALDRAADAIRDTLLDWDLEPEERAAKPPPVPLPALDPKVLVAALREPVEAALEDIAETLNQAPDARALAATEPNLRPILEGLLVEAVVRCEELRLGALVERLPTAEGGWAQKYRRMKAAEG